MHSALRFIYNGASTGIPPALAIALRMTAIIKSLSLLAGAALFLAAVAYAAPAASGAGAHSAPAASGAKGKPKEDLRLEVARQWEAKGEYDKAVQELRVYLSEHPDSPEIYARIGGMRMKQGNFKLAGENYKIALGKNPNLAAAREGLATAYEKQGDKAKAEEERKKLPGAKSASAAVATPAQGKPSAKTDDELPAPHQETPEATAAPVAARPAARASGSDEAYSPALDSASAHGSEGIYADKDFLAAVDLYKQGKLEAMAGPLRRCLGKHPGHPGAYYLGGVMRYDMGEYGKALFNLKRGSAYPDRGFNTQFYLGRIYQKQERFPEATAAYKEYLKHTPSEAGRKQAEGYLAEMGGNAKATPASEAAKPAAPAEKPKPAQEVTEATGKHGAHEEEAGKHGKEAKDGEKSAEKEGEAKAPEKPATPVPVAQAKALVLGRDGDFLFLIPDSESPSGKKLHEAHLLYKAEKFEKCVNALKETMLGYGGSDNALAAGLNLASAYQQLGLWENARDRVMDEVGTAPRDSVKFFDAAQYLLAVSHLGLRDGEKAEKALLKIQPDAPNGPTREEVEYRLTQAGELLQDSKKYSGYLEKAYAGAKSPLRKAEYAQRLGLLHSKYAGMEKAMDWFRKATVDCGDGKGNKDSALAVICAESQLRIADMTFRKKDWKAAMAQYRQFAAKYPEHKESAWVHYQMANIYRASGNFESALNEYKRVIDNYPDSYWSSQAKWKREDTIWQKEYEEVLD